MAEPRKITHSPHGSSGVDITYNRSRRTLIIGGWYDHFVGIEPLSIGLGEFCRRLGISAKDVEKTLEMMVDD